MSKTVIGSGLVIAGAATGIAASAVLYVIVIGAFSIVAAGELAGLWRGAWSFATTFGLLSGAHWALACATTRLGESPRAMLLAKIAMVALVAIALVLALTGDRWSTMFDDLRGPAVLLIVIWIAMTHFVSRNLEKRTPARTPAGA